MRLYCSYLALWFSNVILYTGKHPPGETFAIFAVFHSTMNLFLQISYGLVDQQYKSTELLQQVLPRIAIFHLKCESFLLWIFFRMQHFRLYLKFYFRQMCLCLSEKHCAIIYIICWVNSLIRILFGEVPLLHSYHIQKAMDAINQ